MKETKIPGVFREKDRLYTINPLACSGQQVYNERLVRTETAEYRSWNPYRSKLAAALLKEFPVNIQPHMTILYLGAASGTTVSHISDILTHGLIYAVEQSPIAATKLLALCRKRQNIIPIIEDAFHADRYVHILSKIDMIYQDISQRNQAEIFLENCNRYLTVGGYGVLMIKARSIDVSLKPQQAYEQVIEFLKKNNLNIHTKTDLSPYEKDHAALLVSKKQKEK